MNRRFLYNCSAPVLDVKIAFCQVCVHTGKLKGRVFILSVILMGVSLSKTNTGDSMSEPLRKMYSSQDQFLAAFQSIQTWVSQNALKTS